MRRPIGAPEIAQLIVDLGMIEVMGELIQVIGSLFVPTFDLIGNHGSFLQRNPVDQRLNLRLRRRICEKVVGYSADDFMAGRSVGERAGDKKNNRA